MQKYIFLVLLVFSIFSCAGKKEVSKSSSKSSSSKNVSASSTALKAVKVAQSYKGTKYKYGGMSKKGIDCSGLMCVSYKQVGISIPRTSSAQSQFGTRKYIGELAPGDLVFFGAKPKSKKVTHVGMVSRVSKDGVYFIHASSSRGVVEDKLQSDYYRQRYISARRIK